MLTAAATFLHEELEYETARPANLSCRTLPPLIGLNHAHKTPPHTLSNRRNPGFVYFGMRTRCRRCDFGRIRYGAEGGLQYHIASKFRSVVLELDKLRRYLALFLNLLLLYCETEGQLTMHKFWEELRPSRCVSQCATVTNHVCRNTDVAGKNPENLARFGFSLPYNQQTPLIIISTIRNFRSSDSLIGTKSISIFELNYMFRIINFYLEIAIWTIFSAGIGIYLTQKYNRQQT